MKTLNLTLTLTILASFAAVSTYADVLVDNRNTAPQFFYALQYKNGAATTTTYQAGDGLPVTDKETDTDFRLFCSDLYTYVSDGFKNSNVGQRYNTSSLANSPFHTDVQKTQLQSLFDHVYTKAFNDDYTYNNSFYAGIFNLAVWEIVNDSSSELSLRKGDIKLTAAHVAVSNNVYGAANTAAFNDALNTLDKWFYAIMNNAWDEVGYDEDKVTLTVYLAEGGNHRSQTFIGVAPTVTPEPATMLICGLGLAGLAFAKRNRKR